MPDAFSLFTEYLKFPLREFDQIAIIKLVLSLTILNHKVVGYPILFRASLCKTSCNHCLSALYANNIKHFSNGSPITPSISLMFPLASSAIVAYALHFLLKRI